MIKFCFQEIESKKNLIKMLLAEPKISREELIQWKDIVYIPKDFKKNLRKKILSYEWIANGMHHNRGFLKLVNSYFRKLTQRV